MYSLARAYFTELYGWVRGDKVLEKLFAVPGANFSLPWYLPYYIWREIVKWPPFFEKILIYYLSD